MGHPTPTRSVQEQEEMEGRVPKTAPGPRESSPTVSPAAAASVPSRDPADLDRHERGRVVWHSSEEDGGPDVGLTFGLGDGRFLWLGEISDQQHAEAGQEVADVDSAGGRWAVLYDETKPRGQQSEVLGKIVSQEAVQTLCLAFARYGRDAEREALADASGTEARRAKTRRGFVGDEGPVGLQPETPSPSNPPPTPKAAIAGGDAP